MKTREPQCVLMKRKGASYIRSLLKNKTKEEELNFWYKKTEELKNTFNKSVQRTSLPRRR